jgi:hypothetical protein
MAVVVMAIEAEDMIDVVGITESIEKLPGVKKIQVLGVKPKGEIAVIP